VTTFKGVLGRPTGTNPTLRFSAYTLNGSKNPQTRVGYSATATASASYTGSPPGTTIGAVVSAAVEVSDNGPSNAALMVYSGQLYAIDLDVSAAQLAHSQATPRVTDPAYLYFYNRTGVASPPPSAFGAYSSSQQGVMTVWAEGWENSAPVTPATGLSPSGSSPGTSPTFTADFRDLNGAYGASSGNGVNTGDALNQYQIQVRRVSDQTLFWNAGSFNATGSEQTANAVGIAYGGTTLVRGTAYEWRLRQSDAFSAWSGWSAWTSFTPSSAGFVTLDNTPTGKVLAISGSTALDFHGRWNHVTAATMTLAQVKLLDGNGTLLQTGAQAAPTSAPIASSPAPGTLFTQTWAQTTFGALGWGRAYQYQIRGYDGSQWSDWSAPRAFTTDAAPTIPTVGSPTGGLIFTRFPLARGSFTDADNTYLTGLTGVMRFTRPDATTVDVTPTYNAAAGHDPWQFQTTAAELNQYGVYAWMLTGYDGTLYSGEQALLANAVFSASGTFDYETGPVVTVTSPADNSTITTSSLTVSWTVTGQVKYQVRVYADSTSTILYDSGLITSASLSHTIPSGYLRNGLAYDLVVSVTNATPLTGYSSIVNITVGFTAPAAVANPTCTAVAITNDPFPTAIRLAWDATTYTAPQFVEYTVIRSADGGPDAAQIVLARITSPTDVSLIDYTPASGYTYTYTVVVVILTGVDVVSSTPVVLQASVNLTGTVLTLLGNGGTYRAVLVNVLDRSHARTHQEAVYTSLSGATPTTIRSRVRYWETPLSALIVADAYATAAQRWSDLDTLDAQNGPVCYRDGLGRKRFCKITDLKLTDQKPNTFYAVDLALRQELAFETGS